MGPRVAQCDAWSELLAMLHWPAATHERQQPRLLYNVVPPTPLRLLFEDAGTLVSDQVRWGWQPKWAAGAGEAPASIGLEHAARAPYFAPTWANRALCPLSGWFEWLEQGVDGLQPYFVRRRDREACFAVALGYFARGGRAADEYDGFVLLTADEGGLVDPQGQRPLVLDAAQACEWLAGDTPRARAEQLLNEQAAPRETFESFPVSRDVADVRKQGEYLIQRR